MDYLPDNTAIDAVLAEGEQREEDKILAEQSAQEKKLKDQQLDAEEAESRKGLGDRIVDTAMEFSKSTAGGLLDTVETGLTAKERFEDMFNGQMEAAGDDYKPEWNPVEDINTWESETWWGQMWRDVVHYGSLAAGVYYGGKAALAAAPKVGLGFAANAVRTAPTWVKGGVVGGAGDALSIYNQDSNLLATLRDRFGFIDTPLSTKDTDHPAMKTTKQVLEGFGIGTAFERALMGIARARRNIGKSISLKPDRTALESADKISEVKRSKAEDAAKAAVDKLLREDTSQYLFKNGVDFRKLTEEQQIIEMVKHQKRRKGKYETWSPPNETAEARATRKLETEAKSREAQQLEMGQLELEFDGFGPYKHKPIADPHQGNAFSTGKPYDIAKQSKRIAKEWGSEVGSTDNIITPAAAQRYADYGFGDKSLNQVIAKQMYGDERLEILGEELTKKFKNPADVTKYAEEKAYEILNGREAGESTPSEFFKDLFEDQNLIADEQVWKAENVVAADIVNASLFTKLRNLGIVGREVMDHLDVTDVGGPIKHIRDNLIVAMTETKRARYILSAEFRALQKNSPKQAAKARKEALANIHSSTKGQVDMMMEMAKTAPTDEFLHSILEAFSMSNTIHNWTDLDNFMRKKLRGETTASGARKTGLIVREMQGMMVNSVLSGPKTPLRAIMGTATATFLRPMAQLIGGGIQYGTSGFKDDQTMRSALAQLYAMGETVPEAAQYFMRRLQGYWSGDLSTIKNRFADFDTRDEEWAMVDWWANNKGTDGDKAAFSVANMARAWNANGLLTYSSKLMASTDDAFTMILARARAKQIAIEDAFNARGEGMIPEITPELVREIQDREYAKIFNPDTGEITDDMLNYTKKEATLTSDVGMFGKSLNAVFDAHPLLKPFYLFGRTGINGMKFTFKHVPILNRFQKEIRDIANASPEFLENVRQYGINTPEELANAKAIQIGRQYMGSAVVFMAGQHYLKGGLTGNGPEDIKTKRSWEAAGWKPRSIKMGDVWVSYDSLEPFNNILAAVADIGDNQKLMGNEWAERGLWGTGLALARGMTSKTYMSGIQLLTDLLSSKDPKAMQKIMASMMNNQVPLSSLRNEMGRLVNPVMRELTSSWTDQIRNRNLLSENIAADELPIKYDILNGEAIRDWDVPTRLFNMISPVQLNFGDSAGRQLLRQSNYNVRMTVYSTPGATPISLVDAPKVRSLFQKAIGDQNIERKLNELAKDPEIQESIARMNADRGFLGLGENRKNDPMTYPHNLRIKEIFDEARAEAWASLSNDPDVIALQQKAQNTAGGNFLRGYGEYEAANETANREPTIENMYRQY